jgi:hypothetical protein
MSASQAQLRIDNPNHPAFLMVGRPPSFSEMQARAAEWLLASWVCLTDPNVIGVRRVDEERNGLIVPMVHIAIPLGYQRRRLAQTLGLKEIEDETNTPRVNLACSAGFDEPHSFIRVPMEGVIRHFSAFMQASVAAPEINDETIATPEHVLEEYARDLRRRGREEALQLRSAVRQALAMKKAEIPSDHIQTLVNKHTRERWIRISNVDKSVRTALRLAIKKAGIQTAPPAADDGSEWAVLFPESEARKLLP